MNLKMSPLSSRSLSQSSPAGLRTWGGFCERNHEHVFHQHLPAVLVQKDMPTAQHPPSQIREGISFVPGANILALPTPGFLGPRDRTDLSWRPTSRRAILMTSPLPAPPPPHWPYSASEDLGRQRWTVSSGLGC